MIGRAVVEQAFGQRRGLAAEPADRFEAADFVGGIGRARPAQLIGRRAFAQELGHFGIKRGSDGRRIATRLDVGIDHELAALGKDLGIGSDAYRHLLLSDQRIIEARAGEAAQHRAARHERDVIGVVEAGDRPHPVDPRGSHLVLDRLAEWGGQIGHRHADRLDLRPGRDRAEPLGHLRLGGGQVDIASQHQDSVVGAIIVTEPLLHIFQTGPAEVCHRADGRVVIGVARGVEVLKLLIFDQAKRLVVTLALLVLDHADLVGQLFLGDRAQQIAHPVAFEHQRPVQRAGRHGLEIVGPVKPGCAVEIGRTDFLQRLEEIARRVFRAVEHQVFEQVGKAGLALGFVLRTDPVPYRNSNNRGLAIGMDQHLQAVGQGELLVGNFDRLHECGQRCRLGLLGLVLGQGRSAGDGQRDDRSGQESWHDGPLCDFAL